MATKVKLNKRTKITKQDDIDSDYQAMLKSAQDVIQNLRNEIEFKASYITRQTMELNELNKVAESFRKEAVNCQQNLYNTKQELEELKNRPEDSSEQVSGVGYRMVKAVNIELNQKNNELKNYNAKLQTANEILKNQVATQEKQIEELLHRIHTEYETNVKFNRDNNELRVREAKLREAIAVLEKSKEKYKAISHAYNYGMDPVRLAEKLKEINKKKEYHWTSKDGTKTPVSELEANHLINIALLLQRKVENGDWWEGGDANEHLGHILKEIKRRGLKV